MSAGVSDQRMKGQGNQVSNGPKDHVSEHEDFDSWRTQHHQSYNTPISTSMASDPYMSNYYGTSFPYQTFGVSDGTWSNGGDPMTFLGSYGGQMGHDSYGMDGMFGGGGGGFGTAFGQPTAAAGFNYFHGNGDYSTWGNSMSRKPHYDDYYRTGDGSMYGGWCGSGVEGIKAVEQGMQGLGLSDAQSGNGVMKVVDSKDLVKPNDKDSVQSVAQVPSVAPKKDDLGFYCESTSQTPTPSYIIRNEKKGPGMPPPPMVPGKHNMDIGTWEGKNGSTAMPKQPVGPPASVRPAWGGPVRGAAGPRAGLLPAAATYPQPGPPQHHQVAIIPNMPSHHPMSQQQPPYMPVGMVPPPSGPPVPSHPVLDELRIKNNYNPTDFDLSAKGARFFVIKSYSEDDIHRSIKYEIWCSTEHGNKRLDQAFREREGKGGAVYLFFSVNGSGHFCGMAQMSSSVDYHASSSVWSQDKWKGQFGVRWIYVKDVPNVQLRHIRLENNENKPVTNSRDTQEVPFDKGRQVLRILHTFRNTTSIFDDFVHYEKRQEEEDSRKGEAGVQASPPGPSGQHHHPSMQSSHKDRESGGRGRGSGRGSRN